MECREASVAHWGHWAEAQFYHRCWRRRRRREVVASNCGNSFSTFSRILRPATSNHHSASSSSPSSHHFIFSPIWLLASTLLRLAKPAISIAQSDHCPSSVSLQDTATCDVNQLSVGHRKRSTITGSLLKQLIHSVVVLIYISQLTPLASGQHAKQVIDSIP